MTIKIFITGGTIDDLEYDSEDKAPKNAKSIIPRLLNRARISCDYSAEVLMMKDSRFVNDGDRRFILEKCQKSKEDKIVITHGTMTMAKTAKFLGSGNLDKTVVLAGSAYPANREKSDVLFNLGFAFAAVKLLPKVFML